MGHTGLVTKGAEPETSPLHILSLLQPAFSGLSVRHPLDYDNYTVICTCMCLKGQERIVGV